MKMLFEGETEIGRCDYELGDAHPMHFEGADYATVHAHTQATYAGKALIKIEHHCFLRHAGDETDQAWDRPEVRVEPVTGSPEEMIARAREWHEQFSERVRHNFPQQYLV